MITVNLPDGTTLQFPEGTSRDVMRQATQRHIAKASAGPTVAAQGQVANAVAPAEIKAITDQAITAYNAGDNEGGARLLEQASRLSIDSGIAPAGTSFDPQTGQMPNLRDANSPYIQPSTQGRAAAMGLGQGLGFNAMDEAVAGLSAATDGAAEGRFTLDRAREDQRRLQEQNPWTYGGAQIGGATATALSGLGAARTLGLSAPTTAMGVAGEGAALGAAEGALSGFGSGEGVGDRAQKALLYGLIGGGIGGAAPSVVSGVRKGTDAVIGGPLSAIGSGLRNGVSAATGGMVSPAGPNIGRASGAVAGTMRRAGMTPDDVSAALRQAMDEGQPEFTIADALGTAGQRKLAGVAIATPDARPTIANALLERQAGQSGRVGRFIQEGLGVTDTAAQRTAALTADRKAAADLAYEAARAGAGPVNLNGTLETIDALLRRDPILGETALSQGPIGTRLNALRNRMQAGGEQLIDFDSVLNMKSDLTSARMSGRGAPEMFPVERALDSALENSSQGYRVANDGYRTASGMINAVDHGAGNARATVRGADTTAAYLRLPPEQQQPFRTGFADPILARIENQPPGVNSVRALTGDGTVAKLNTMASDPALLQRRLGREDTMFGTQQAALGGPQTALNAVDAGDSNAGAALVGMMTAPKTTIMQGIGRGIGNLATGQSATTRAEIARMLMSRDVQGALQPAMLADQRMGSQNRAVEALIRALVRPTQ